MDTISRKPEGQVLTPNTLTVDRSISIRRIKHNEPSFHVGTTAANDIVITSGKTGKQFFLPLEVILHMAIDAGIDNDDPIPPAPTAVGSAA